MLRQFADSRAERVRALCWELVGAEHRTRRQQARTLNLSAVDVVAQLHVYVFATVGAHRHLRGEAGLQTVRGAPRRLRRCCGAVSQVNVAVDQSRQHRRLAQVDDPRIGGNLHAPRRSDVRNSVASNEHDLIRQIHARLHVEQAAGANGDHLRLRGRARCRTLSPDHRQHPEPTQNCQPTHYSQRAFSSHAILLARSRNLSGSASPVVRSGTVYTVELLRRSSPTRSATERACCSLTPPLERMATRLRSSTVPVLSPKRSTAMPSNFLAAVMTGFCDNSRNKFRTLALTTDR